MSSAPGRVDRLALSAPAKVNFGLRIVGRRPDGYHLLESLFLPISLADGIALERRADGPNAPAGELRVTVEGAASAGVPADARNLAVRAVRAFEEAAGRPASFWLHLRKEIPAAAGLGGGSSDAAAVLRGLAALLPDALPPGALAALALRLGADVPFFLDPRPALVTGIGERIEPLADVPPAALVLAHPGSGLGTAEVYRSFDAGPPALTPPGAGSTMRALSGLRGRDGRIRWSIGTAPDDGPGDVTAHRKALASLLENDLEPAARRLCPAVQILRERLEAAGALAVGMSGSGPSVFGVFKDEPEAHEALSGLSLAAPAWARVVTTVGSPRAGAGASPNW